MNVPYMCLLPAFCELPSCGLLKEYLPSSSSCVSLPRMESQSPVRSTSHRRKKRKNLRITPEPATSHATVDITLLREGAEESLAYCTAAEGEPALNSEDNSDFYTDMPILLPPSYELSVCPELSVCLVATMDIPCLLRCRCLESRSGVCGQHTPSQEALKLTNKHSSGYASSLWLCQAPPSLWLHLGPLSLWLHHGLPDHHLRLGRRNHLLRLGPPDPPRHPG